MIDQTLVPISQCVGCFGCSNACPVQCISMIEDKEGFLYPHVDYTTCISCFKCIRVCPVIEPPRNYEKTESFVCKNISTEEKLKSSSGSVFTELAKRVLSINGTVFGAVFDENFNVVHKGIDKILDLELLRGSKYVQSAINNTYSEVKTLVCEGKPVLFSGTPCQIAGLEAFLGKKYDNLIMVDFICHGVPSPKVFKKYLTHVVKSDKSGIISVDFRSKINGWKNFSMNIKTKNLDYCQDLTKDVYLRGFLKDLYLRPSCHHCKFKTALRISDITMADAWGACKVFPELDDDLGLSLIVVHSLKGNQIFSEARNNLDVHSVELESLLPFNLAMNQSSKPHKNRDVFFSRFDLEPISTLIEDCIKDTLLSKWYNQLKYFRNKLLKKG